jgi:PAS domain S-box-containing protein
MSASQILVVEDEAIVATAIKNELEQFGYAVPDMAASAAEAVEKASGKKPDLVLMDIHLRGEQDGIEAAREIHDCCGIPVVYLSAFADPQTVARAGATAAFGYLLKPYEERELQTTIEMALAKHRAEQRLEETERLLAAILEGIDDAVIATGPDDQILFVNMAGEGLTRWGKEAAVGAPVTAICNLVEGEQRLPLLNLADTAVGESRTVELPTITRLVTRDGRATPVEGYVTPIIDRRGEFLGKVLILRSITARFELERVRRQNEDQTRQAQKMEAVRRLAVDMNTFLGECLDQCSTPRIEVSYSPAAALWPVNVDEALMGQALLNLCLNAQDAMPDGGQLTLECRNVVLREEDVPNHPGARPGEFVLIRFSDMGRGMTSEPRARLFEPFSITKESGQVVGLDMAFVFAVVEQHYGWIECSSEVGRGTRFDVYLPRHGAEAARNLAPVSVLKPRSAQPTILLVDADPMVRSFGRTILEAEGYQVLVAEDGVQAVEIFRQAPERIDLAIIDLDNPQRLVELDTDVEVLFSSALFSEDRPLGLGSDHCLGVISKPFFRQELLNMVQRVLARRSEWN